VLLGSWDVNEISSRINSLRMLMKQLEERWMNDASFGNFPREFPNLVVDFSSLLSWPGLPERILRTPPSFQVQFDGALDLLVQSLSLAGYQRPNAKLITKIISGIVALAPYFDFITRRNHGDDDQISVLQERSNSLHMTLRKIDPKYMQDPDSTNHEDSAFHNEDRELLQARLDTSETKRRIAEEKAAQARRQTENLGNKVGQLISVVNELERKSAADVEARSKFEALVALANRTVDEIGHIKKTAESLSSEAADNVMSGNYGQLAKDHENSELKFRAAAFFLFGIASVGAALVAWNVGWFGYEQLNVPIWVSFAKKISVSLGIAGIGLYSSRLAAHHRRLAVWSKSLGVQLKTLESYLAGISDDRLKDGIREQFAKLTFSGPPDLILTMKGRGDERIVSAVAGAVADSLRKE